MATLAAAITFVVAGLLSGLLIDEHGGALGALEWVLRTLVVIAAVVFVVAGAVLVTRVRGRVRSRPLGWLLACSAFLAFAWLVAIPVGFGVYLTHLPSRDSVHDADLGARKEAVALVGADGVRLRGWYVPSRNRAAVIALHGTGSSRLGVVRHARLLARYGYGVLALDLRGHGESDGRSTSAPWTLDEDVDAAVGWLAARPEVEARSVGLLGVSLGAEVALRVAARRDDVGATVAEGAMGSARDASLAGVSWPALAQLAGLSAVSVLLTGEETGTDADLVERISPAPLLLISSGSGTEAGVNRVFVRRGGRSTQHWNLPDAAHGRAIRSDPAGYERRVVGFLDSALSSRPPRRR
ncbi:MAG: alpha/beta fold hydrolase [Solirubrobacteraceae bacterium]|nr:alpha/beta fold hydrolase [Solirubrobacteraceae bacterium]